MYSYRSATTKRGQYQKFQQTDKTFLRRQNAHCKDALKTTPTLRALGMHVDSVRVQHVDQDVLSHLAELQRLFDNLIKSSGIFSHLLRFIKDVYTAVLSSVVMSSHGRPENVSPGSCGTQPASGELLQLKKQLHQLEVESRVLLQENDRLRKEFDSQLAFKVDIAIGLESEVSTPQVQDYTQKVEELQIEIAKHHASFAEVAKVRKGRIPLSVCHQLEQCLREAEIEIKKQQRKHDLLKEQVQIEELKFNSSD